METKGTWKELNPQQEAFLAYYLDPKSETWSDARQSALRAGYEDEYARNIMSLMPKWLSENLEESGLVAKAYANLYEFIDDKENKNIKWDATKFTLTTLKKDKFSEKKQIEITGLTDKDKKELLNLLNDKGSTA